MSDFISNLSTWIPFISILGGLFLILVSAFVYVFVSQRRIKKMETLKLKKQKKIEKKTVVKNKKINS